MFTLFSADIPVGKDGAWAVGPYFKDLFSAFIADTRGNFAMMMSGAVMLIMVGVGAAIDFNGMSSKQTKYQALADMAVLAAAASGEDAPGLLRQIAQDVVAENNLSGDTLTTNLSITESNTIRVVVTGEYEMAVMNLFGYNAANVNALAEAPPKGLSKINLAMVLDTTASMEGSRISTLQTAADDMVESLSGGAPGDVMISIVPFGRYVRIDTANDGQPWLEVQPTQEHCWDKLDQAASEAIGTCADPTDESDEMVCTNPVYYEHCEDIEWYGCMGSRAEPWHKRDYFGGTKLQAFAGGGSCQSEILPLTSDLTAVETAIANLYTEDETYIPAGLTWGWRSLNPEMPFTEANTADKHERKNALLLMTDGQNTRSYGGTQPIFNGVFHWEGDQADADSLTAELCASIKNDDIVIYTVAFEVTDADTINLLRNCATDANKFFDADDDIALEEAFGDIGDELAQVRLSK